MLGNGRDKAQRLTALLTELQILEPDGFVIVGENSQLRVIRNRLIIR